MGFGKGKGFSPPPAPPPAALDIFNTIEPQIWFAGGSGMWITRDISHLVHPLATGLIIHAINKDLGQYRRFGVRKTGSNIIANGCMDKDSHTWAITGLNDEKEFDAWAGYTSVQPMWIMGYTGPAVHFLDAYVDLMPTEFGVWIPVDISSYCPGALAVIVSLGGATVFSHAEGVRKNGSTDDWYNGTWHNYGIIGCDSEGIIEVKAHGVNPHRGHIHLLGYIDAGVATHTNSKDITPAGTGAWVTMLCQDLIAKPKWAVVQKIGTTGTYDWGCRKNNSFRDIRYPGNDSEWSFIHLDDSAMAQAFRGHANATFKLSVEVP